jgi:hypothetical protein
MPGPLTLKSATLWALLALAGSLGCQPNRPSSPPPTPPPATRPAVNGKPLIDFSRGAGGFPLSGESLPATREELVTSLLAGYRARVSIPDDGRVRIVASGEDYPTLDALTIDLTDTRIKGSYRPASMRNPVRLTDGLDVKRLQYLARPLRYVDGSTNLSITARDARLQLLRGRRGETGTLVMTEAKDGRVNFDVPISDLRAMLLSAAKAGGSRNGYFVRDVDAKFASDDSRSLSCDIRVRGFWLLLPTALRLTARIDVDDAFNARLSGVRCTGEDVGGFLVAGVIDGALRKYDGRVMPLAAFPGGKIKVRDLHIGVDDALHIFVGFGG